jgi:hypothetical protein
MIIILAISFAQYFKEKTYGAMVRISLSNPKVQW